MFCSNCRRNCSHSYQGVVCNDGCVLHFCDACAASAAALERMLKVKYQQCIMPPDGVAVLALIAQHKGAGDGKGYFSPCPWN